MPLSTDLHSAAFVVDRIPRQVWDALAVPPLGAAISLPGFDDDAKVLERDPERLLRCRDRSGTEQLLRFEPVTAAGWPTRVTLSQPVGASTPEVWRIRVANLQLFLEREIDLAGSHVAAEPMGFNEVGFGLEVVEIEASSRLARCGLETGDVMLTLAGVRTLAADVGRAVLEASTTRSVAVTWARGTELHEGEVPTGS